MNVLLKCSSTICRTIAVPYVLKVPRPDYQAVYLTKSLYISKSEYQVEVESIKLRLSSRNHTSALFNLRKGLDEYRSDAGFGLQMKAL